MFAPSKSLFLVALILFFLGCKKSSDPSSAREDTSLSFTVNDTYNGTLTYRDLNLKPVVKITLTEPIDASSLMSGIKLTGPSNTELSINTILENENKTLIITPQNNLSALSDYELNVSSSLRTSSDGRLLNPVLIKLSTGIDNSDKFPRISDEELLTLVQRQTFKYFYDFAHPVSGLARERNSSGNTVTSGGSGFGIMALVTGVHRGFITRNEGLVRLQKIVAFLKKADRFHGAFPHWLDGNTGKVLPFSTKDNGGDLVETSFLMQGLITARQYFSNADAAETNLRNDINELYSGVEWDWYQKDDGNVLYWHWSPNYNWEQNLPLKGWNEGLITYVLAAASDKHTISKEVYDAGWAGNGSMRNGNTYYGIQLPLGPANGGPLFFEHYSFLGINPIGLADSYANYEQQTKAHTLINYNHCVANPNKFSGYSENCWGLTASDLPNGYGASSPSNDKGSIAPTAALSSFPYTPEESMKALKFFYYKLGDKLWKEQGFTDAFSLQDKWFATSHLAIDQGPIIIMIENHRSKLLWNLFMSAPEIKNGLKKLGFTSPNI